MEQEPRPYLRNDLSALAVEVERRSSDTAFLQSILCELKYRTTKAARNLRATITQRLIEISSESFLWPSTHSGPSSVALDQEQFQHSQGLLSYLGYRVGQNGGLRSERQHILDYVYNEPVPNVISPAYMAEWGAARTGIRLRKTAESIAAFTRNAKRRRGIDLALSIQEWEEDLRYLKPKYYDGRYDFGWPITSLDY